MKTRRMCKPVSSGQAGFSLIELMVAVTIGLFVALGLSTFFVQMKTTFNTQQQMAELQDAERLALTVLTNTIESARYFPDPLTQTVGTAFPAIAATATEPAFVAGQGLMGADATTTVPSKLASRFVTAPGDTVMDCLGNAHPVGAAGNRSVTNSFSVVDGNLQCTTSNGTTTTTAILVANVRSLSVLYGTDTDSNGFADRYLDAAAVTSITDGWLRVRSARVTLTFDHPFAASLPGSPTTIAWTQSIALMNHL